MTDGPTIFDNELAEFVTSMKWSDKATETEKALVLGNLNGFVGRLNIGRAKKLLAECQARIRAQTNVGLVSEDPGNEDPQHEFQELLVDLDDALGSR